MRALGRNKTKAAAARGKSKSPPRKNRGLFYRLVDDVYLGRFKVAPATLSAAVFLLLVLVYGVFAGGYVRGTMNAGLRMVDGLVRDAGFVATDVSIYGRRNVERELVLMALGVSEDISIFKFDLEAARKRIEMLGWVRSVRISRLLPKTIKVEITERRPLAIWQRGGRLSVIDENGVPLSDGRVASFASLPLIVGYDGAKNSRELLEKLDKWPALKARMRAAVRVSGRRWNIRLRNDVNIRLPEKGVEKALAELARLDEEQGLLSRDIKAVDLRIADRLTIELGEEAAARRKASLLENVAAGKKKDKRI